MDIHQRQARIRELSAKDLHHGLDRAEYLELERLRDENQMARLNAQPVPTCCADAKEYRTVQFSVPDDASGSPKSGTWYPSFIDQNWDPNERSSAWYESMPPARFCVFCGTALPKMRLKATPPEPLCKIDDGGYYCSTCHERLHACTCLPPAAAFEPEP